MSMFSGVRQQGIVANGDVTAGNLTKLHSETHYHGQGAAVHPVLASLYSRYKDNAELTNHACSMLDELSAYFRYTDAAKSFQDLSEKLDDGDRSGYLEDARWLKQQFRRKIEKYIHSPVAQEIFVCLLGMIKAYFKTGVEHYFGILSDAEIDALILKDVVEKTSAQIPGSDPLITHDTLYGMIYFLTGNCFLKWVK